MPHPKSSSEPATTAGEVTVVFRAPPFDLAHYLRERAGLIERQLAISVTESNGPANRLIEAMRYSLMAGGKRGMEMATGWRLWPWFRPTWSG